MKVNRKKVARLRCVDFLTISLRPRPSQDSFKEMAMRGEISLLRRKIACSEEKIAGFEEKIRTAEENVRTAEENVRTAKRNGESDVYVVALINDLAALRPEVVALRTEVVALRYELVELRKLENIHLTSAGFFLPNNALPSIQFKPI